MPPVDASAAPLQAVVTGATDGIGRATAIRLAAAGWRVGVLGRNAERTASVVAEIEATRSGSAYGIVADLSSMAATAHAVTQVQAATKRLDALVLNANHITQEHRVTPEGWEANLAIGWLSRVVMMRGLEAPLVAGRGQVLSVVGMNLGRLDTDDLSLPGSPGGAQTLGQWQWAIQVFARAWNARGLPQANTYMPGLVKTKILDDEPGRLQRLAIKAAMLVMASTPKDSAERIVAVLDQARASGARDHYFATAKDKGARDLDATEADLERIWALSLRATDPWVGPHPR